MNTELSGGCYRMPHCGHLGVSSNKRWSRIEIGKRTIGWSVWGKSENILCMFFFFSFFIWFDVCFGRHISCNLHEYLYWVCVCVCLSISGGGWSTALDYNTQYKYWWDCEWLNVRAVRLYWINSSRKHPYIFVFILHFVLFLCISPNFWCFYRRTTRINSTMGLNDNTTYNNNNNKTITTYNCRYSLYGAVITGPTMYVWIRIANRLWPRTDFKSSISKALTELICYDTWAIAAFLFGMSLLEGRTLNEANAEVCPVNVL